MTQKYLDILGKPVEDLVTKTKGIAVSVSFELYGCVQILVNPGNDKDGKPRDHQWFDFKRLKVTGKGVMPAPDFSIYDVAPGKRPAGGNGSDSKPAMPHMPVRG